MFVDNALASFLYGNSSAGGNEGIGIDMVGGSSYLTYPASQRVPCPRVHQCISHRY